MKIKILIFVFICLFLNSYSQKFKFSVGSSNIFFENFNERKILFSGFSADYTFLFGRLGWNFEADYYLPQTYYGKTNEIPVYAKGDGFSMGTALYIQIFKPESEKWNIYALSGFSFLTHKGKFNKEPFINNSLDMVYNAPVNDIDIDVTTGFVGVGFTYKIGYIPYTICLNRRMKIINDEYDDFITSGYFEAKLCITFPILFTPPPTEIIKITY
ncbi:MAG: hypothetical protein ABIJ97_09345 [Bacteroidota bacterium]